MLPSSAALNSTALSFTGCGWCAGASDREATAIGLACGAGFGSLGSTLASAFGSLAAVAATIGAGSGVMSAFGSLTNVAATAGAGAAAIAGAGPVQVGWGSNRKALPSERAGVTLASA